MTSFLAINLFDNPWLVVVIFLVSALADWLSKRRKAAQEPHPSEAEVPPPSPAKPQGETSVEEALRRLVGEEPVAQAPTPPPILREAGNELPPVQTWREEQPFQTAKQTVPPLRSPIAVATANAITAELIEEQQEHEQAARHFEQLNEQGRHPAMVHTHRAGRRSRADRRQAALAWRNPQRARDAFIASLVFAPPKGLEP